MVTAEYTNRWDIINESKLGRDLVSYEFYFSKKINKRETLKTFSDNTNVQECFKGHFERFEALNEIDCYSH